MCYLYKLLLPIIYITCHQFNNAIKLNEVNSSEPCVIYSQNNKRNFWSIHPFDRHYNRSTSLTRKASNEKRTSIGQSRSVGVKGEKKKRKRTAKIAQRLLPTNSRLAGLQTTRKQCAEDPCSISPFSILRRLPVLSVGRNEVSITSLHLIRHSSSSISRASREIASPFFPPTVGLLATPS